MAARVLKLLLTVLLAAAALPCHAADKGVNIDIEVFQALREGVKGVGFSNEYARIGLPFPDGMVKEHNGRASLAVEGREYQTRALKRWPDGSVKWALVEFLASPSKGGSERVHLVDGSGVSAGAPLAVDKDGVVSVDTGPMQVEIRKDGFNLFDKVTVGGKEIVRAGESRGIVLVNGEGKEFLASSYKGTKVAIEENGPVKSTVRVDGRHAGGQGWLLDYTVRLFFFKGQSRVKAQYTLRNASREHAEHIFIRSLGLETKPALTGEKKVTVSTHKGTQELDAQKGPINFYQAVSDFPWMSDGDSFYYQGPIPPDYKREDSYPRGYSVEGYWISQAGKPVAEGKRKEFPELGYVDMSDSSGRGITVGIRYMAGQWPKVLKSDESGTVTAALWPEDNKQGYWIRYGSHNTFEVMYLFHPAGSTKPGDEMLRFQYPLVARAPLEWYNRNVEGIYPLYHAIKFSEEQKLAQRLGIRDRVGWRRAKFKVWRYHYWGHGAFLNQHDFARIAQMNFIRDDRDLAKAGEAALLAESMINYYADWAVQHSDDYDYSKQQYEPKERRKEADYAKVVFEWEHQHWYGMALYYYMTGDERVREAILDWGEYIKAVSRSLNLTFMRVWGTGMFSLAAMYEFTGDEEFMKLADVNFDRLLKASYNPKNPSANIFIDWERGCVLGGSGSGWPGIKADLMLGSILYDGLLNYYLFMKGDNQFREKAYALLMKISDFMYREPYFEGVKGNKKEWAYWIPYIYNLQDREKSNHSYKLIGQASFWTTFPYELTGERKWVDRMEKMMKMALWDEAGVWDGLGYLDHPGFQTMGYFLTVNDSKR